MLTFVPLVLHIPSCIGRHPATVHTVGQHLPDVLAHFLVDERGQLGVHRFEEVSMFVPIQCQVVELKRVGLQIKQLNVVQLVERIQRRR